jgi:hypothetical protein
MDMEVTRYQIPELEVVVVENLFQEGMVVQALYV